MLQGFPLSTLKAFAHRLSSFVFQEVFLPADKLSIIVIPEGHRRICRFQLSRGWLKAALLLVVLAVGGFAGLLCDRYRVHVDRAELRQLRSERGTYERQLHLLAGQLQGLRQEMVVLANNDTKVRLIAKLIKPAKDVPIGIGGPMEVEAGAELSSLQRQIDGKAWRNCRARSTTSVRCSRPSRAASRPTAGSPPVSACAPRLFRDGARCIMVWISRPAPAPR
jgi:hypothetical protein